MQLVLSIIGVVLSVVFGVWGLCYAYFTNREKAKLETMVHTSLSITAGNILKIRESAHLAWDHFDIVRKHSSKLPSSEEKESIHENAQRGTGDAAAAERMLANLLNEVLGTQEALFGTRKIQHPDTEGKATLQTFGKAKQPTR